MQPDKQVDKYLFFHSFNREELSLAYTALSGQTISRVKYSDFYKFKPIDVFRVLGCEDIKQINGFISLQAMHGKTTLIYRNNKKLYLSEFTKQGKCIETSKHLFTFQANKNLFSDDNDTYVVLFGGISDYAKKYYDMQQNIATIIVKYYICHC